MEEKRPVGRPREDITETVNNKILIDLSTLKLASDTLKKEVERLNNLKVNMEAEIHALEFKKENVAKLDKVDIKKQVYDEEVRLNKKASELDSREQALTNRETSFKDRLKMLEEREQSLLNLEEKKKELAEERSRFFKYKFDLERELETAKITIEEAKAIENDYTIKENALKAREIKIQKQEKYWNDEIGKLEHDKKEFQMEKENILALKQMEVKNG